MTTVSLSDQPTRPTLKADALVIGVAGPDGRVLAPGRRGVDKAMAAELAGDRSTRSA